MFYVDPVAKSGRARLLPNFNVFRTLNICTSLKKCKFTFRIFLAPYFRIAVNPLSAELNPIRHLLALVGDRHIVHVSRVRVKDQDKEKTSYKQVF